MQVMAKAQSVSDRSGAIVVSFDAKHSGGVIDGATKAVIRKRVPRDHTVSMVFVYANAPESKVVVRRPVKSIRNVSLKETLELRDKVNLTNETIQAYFRGVTSVGMYELGEPVNGRQPSLQQIQEQLLFYPPQSFLYVSIAARKVLDELCTA